MTRCVSVAVLMIALLTSGCGGGNDRLIVGKWATEGTPVKLTMELTADGKCRITLPLGPAGMTTEGTYKLEGDTLETTMNNVVKKAKIKLTATELEINDEGKVIKYKKQ